MCWIPSLDKFTEVLPTLTLPLSVPSLSLGRENGTPMTHLCLATEVFHSQLIVLRKSKQLLRSIFSAVPQYRNRGWLYLLSVSRRSICYLKTHGRSVEPGGYSGIERPEF